MSGCFRSPRGVGHYEVFVVSGSNFICSTGAVCCDGKGKDKGFPRLCIAVYRSLKTGKRNAVTVLEGKPSFYSKSHGDAWRLESVVNSDSPWYWPWRQTFGLSTASEIRCRWTPCQFLLQGPRTHRWGPSLHLPRSFHLPHSLVCCC